MIEFKSFIAAHGYEPPENIVPGRFIRFGKNKSAWARLFDDCTGGIFGDWRTGEEYIWQSGSKRIDRQVVINVQILAKKEREDDYMAAAIRAQKRFDRAAPADPMHPYLIAKKVQPYGLKQVGNHLMVPVHSVAGEMHSLQLIDHYGTKQFMPGGRVSGGCYMIGQMSDKQTLICEGFATGASIQADTGHLVLIAFNAANLIKVAVDFHKHFPDQKILVCGDDDWLDPLNPGKTAAIEAARAVGGKYLLPEFGEDRQPGWTDFNDLLNRGVA